MDAKPGLLAGAQGLVQRFCGERDAIANQDRCVHPL
jgi:hypothetical protein